ncbi:MAG: hypothetical protein LPK80_00085 [Bacteroidota bacterium]|nr:hypothetical protein [Bacteroidota bacterium]
MARMKTWWNKVWGFFPMQLLALHVRRSLLLLTFWILLFGMVGERLFVSIGIPHLFLTPEYLGTVNYLAFFIIGLVLGLFVMAFHISSYIFYSYRYPFLATLNRPLYRFSINNSFIPILFFLFYCYRISVSLDHMGMSSWNIFLDILGLFIGTIFSVFLAFTYFFSTMRSTPFEAVTENLEKPLKLLIKQDSKMPAIHFSGKVTHYLRNFWSVRRTRSVAHYPLVELTRALQQHHLNAAIYFLAIIFILFGLSIFGQSKFFQIPAGASILLMMTLYLMITGAIFSRFKTWTYTVVIIGILLFNYLSGLPGFQKIHYAFGMDYSDRTEYSYEVLDSLTSEEIQSVDKQRVLEMLENWRSKFPEDRKPKMVIINSSGGGLRSSLWTLGGMQYLDSLTDGEILRHTFLVTGSSGGMIGAAYYRELHLHEKRGDLFGVNSRTYFDRLGQDMLNPIGFSMVVNDLFVPIRKVRMAGQSYPVDRGYSFDRELIQNTDSLLDRRIIDYRELEYSGRIPMMILAPTLISDGRRMLISAQDLSFLTVNRNPFVNVFRNEVDGIELRRLFKDQQADSLWFPTALRMSASFPYITPLISLPSEPRIEVIDAGARDNTGFELSFRLVYEFRDWITENTSGVVFLQFLANKPDAGDITGTPYRTRFDALIKPIGGVVQSFSNFQEFSEAENLHYSDSWVDFRLNVVRFPLLTMEEEVSLSWHLTRQERQQIWETIRDEGLDSSFQQVIHLVR